jgi:hypothetical protein
MSLESSTSPQPSAKIQSKASPKKHKMSQERVMVMFTLFFTLGILLLVVMPEGHSARDISLGIYSIVVFWAMFRFCM